MFERIPTLKARDVMRVLHSLGFKPIRQVGSHIFYKHLDGRTTMVSRHDREDTGRGLLRKILQDIEITPEEFMKYL